MARARLPPAGSRPALDPEGPRPVEPPRRSTLSGVSREDGTGRRPGGVVEAFSLVRALCEDVATRQTESGFRLGPTKKVIQSGEGRRFRGGSSNRLRLLIEERLADLCETREAERLG